MPKVEGNLTGLKPSQKRALERIYRRKSRSETEAVTQELAATLCSISSEIGRQVGIMLDRRGHVEYVIVGDANEIVIPELSRVRAGAGRLKGLRLIHTHLKEEPLSKDDFNDLVMLRLDLVMSLGVTGSGAIGVSQVGYLNTDPEHKKNIAWKACEPDRLDSLDFSFAGFFDALDKEYARTDTVREAGGDLSAILVHISTKPQKMADASVDELAELARTEKIAVLDKLVFRSEPNPKSLVGEGRLKELVVRAMTLNADMILFDQELSPAQARYIDGITDMPLLDRTQLILRIFARRAHTADGKLRVELANLEYQLPRIGAKDDALSRIRGGIGMRGPGETTMEVTRRRIKERMRTVRTRLEKAGHGRQTRRQKRLRSEIPQVAIVGYTNAGKSTLLNAITKSSTLVEDKLFATLDPMSRRVRFPKDMDVVFSDTVGFIRDLPESLLGAFRSTLEELKDADLLVHLVDLSDPDFEEAKRAVEEILAKLEIDYIPTLTVLNKTDMVTAQISKNASKRYEALCISASQKKGLGQLVAKIINALEEVSTR